MYNTQAHNAYTQNHIDVESPEKLVQMLYEGVLRFNLQAKKAMNTEDFERKSHWINKSTKIISQLIHMLDFSHGEVASYLYGLYNHQLQQLALANLHMDTQLLDEVTHVFKSLSEAWKESIDVA